ncbi:unnamed protein product [Acanthoscelides obtectus]|uniref:DNA-directed RNA polymerase III subunit RPC9 n=1 Tax=Acanthoscelides obtectus TaxID=200917 RepID=A0A9P0P7U8_ACAOB|nr:unnamed protein product [Acanthoscelides obtectus]CAK1672670.1 DNA-directed RNA polymerase III subunit RPC9 [Acanthoscelides obtectus]
MEIVSSNCASLSNYEVFEHLQKVKDCRPKHKGQLATITYETLRYLENTPCKEQTAQSIKECIRELAPFKLHKTELLMIINNPPITPLEIQFIPNYCEENCNKFSQMTHYDIDSISRAGIPSEDRQDC